MSETAVAEVEPDLTHFTNRYPEPPEILRNGGLCGTKYCYVPGHRQRLYTELDPPWSAVVDVPVLKFTGPLGTVDTVIVMGSGAPIKGAADDNGIREWFVDIELEEAIGVPASKDSPLVGVMAEINKSEAKSVKSKPGE